MRNALVLAVGLVAAVGGVGTRLAADLRDGGHEWRQGDWLINGPVRRGLAGDVAIWFADRLGSGPVGVVVTWQAVLLVVVILGWFAANARTGFDARLVLLTIAPLGLPFWAWDRAGSGRKELFVYAAFGLVAAAPRSARSVAAGAVFLTAGVLAHEALVLFLPAWCLAMWLAERRGLDRRWALGATGAVGIAALVAIALTMIRAGTGDVEAVCGALTSRGVDGDICSGAIAVAADTAVEGRSFTASVVVASDWIYALYALVAGVTLALLWPLRTDARTSAAAIVGLSLPFVPLWFVGIDWGRWLHFGFMSTLFVATVALNSGAAPARPPMRRGAFWLWLALGLIWTVPHLVTAPFQLGPLGRLVS